MFNRETGGVKTPRRIIDQQSGPECGYEAVENVIQLVHPVGNNISERVLKRLAIFGGFAGVSGGQSVLYTTGYRYLLAYYGITSTWMEFNPDRLVEALRQNRVAIAIVAPTVLDPSAYPAGNELHAIVVTNFGVNANQLVIRYTGIDSNFGGDERHWSRDRFYNAVAAAGNRILITDVSIAQVHWATYDVLTRVLYGFRVAPSPTP